MEPLASKIESGDLLDITEQEALAIESFLQHFTESGHSDRIREGADTARLEALSAIIDFKRGRSNGISEDPELIEALAAEAFDISLVRQYWGGLTRSRNILNPVIPALQRFAEGFQTVFGESTGYNFRNENDFILRPNGEVISTHPNDTIIGLKDIDTSMQEAERTTVAALATIMGTTGSGGSTVVDEIRGLREDMKKTKSGTMVQNNYTSRFNPMNVARSLTMEVL